MYLEVYTNLGVHLALRQALSVGQKSSHTPKVPVSRLAVVLHGHLSKTVRRSPEMSWTTAEVTLAELDSLTRPETIVTRQKMQNKPPEQQKNNRKTDHTQTRAPYPNPKKKTT